LLCTRGSAGRLNFPNYNYRIPPGTPGSFSVREIQQTASAAAAQYAGRPFDGRNFVEPGGDSASDSDVDFSYDEPSNVRSEGAGPSYNYDDPSNRRVNDNPPNDDDEDEDDDDDDDSSDDDNSDDDDDPRLFP
jgi:hypothetical protein